MPPPQFAHAIARQQWRRSIRTAAGVQSDRLFAASRRDQPLHRRDAERVGEDRARQYVGRQAEMVGQQPLITARRSVVGSGRDSRKVAAEPRPVGDHPPAGHGAAGEEGDRAVPWSVPPVPLIGGAAELGDRHHGRRAIAAPSPSQAANARRGRRARRRAGYLCGCPSRTSPAPRCAALRRRRAACRRPAGEGGKAGAGSRLPLLRDRLAGQQAALVKPLLQRLVGAGPAGERPSTRKSPARRPEACGSQGADRGGPAEQRPRCCRPPVRRPRRLARPPEAGRRRG